VLVSFEVVDLPNLLVVIIVTQKPSSSPEESSKKPNADFTLLTRGKKPRPPIDEGFEKYNLHFYVAKYWLLQ
jgi:hypothetical protein